MRSSTNAREWEMRCDLAAAFRLSVRMGLNAGIGNHFSLMLPDSGDRFLVNARGLLFQEITASNLLVVDYINECPFRPTLYGRRRDY